MPAIALLATMPELAVAGAAVLLLWAAGNLLAKPLEWILGQIPVVGGQAVGFVSNGLASVAGYAQSWAEGSVSALTQLISAPVAAIQRIVTSIVSAIETTAGQVLSLGGVVAGGFGALGALVASAVAQLGNALTKLDVLGITSALTAVAVEALRHVTIPAAISTAVAGAAAFTRAQIAAALGIVSTDVKAVEAEVRAVAYAGDQAIRRAEADFGAALGAGVGVLEGEIGQLRGLVNPLVAAGLLTLVPTIARTLEDALRDCVTPTCSVVKPQIPTLTALMDIGTLMIVGGMVGEAIANPEGTAQVTAGVVGGVEGLAHDLFGAFTGASV